MLRSDLNDILCVLTNPQLLQVPLKLWFLLQHLQQVSGFHALQLYFVVDVDFVVEADVNQARPVFTILTGILTYEHKQKMWCESQSTQCQSSADIILCGRAACSRDIYYFIENNYKTHTQINIPVNAHSIFAASKTLYLNPNLKFGGKKKLNTAAYWWDG